MAYLLDTSILGRLANAHDTQHAVAAGAVLELHRRGEVLHIAPQVMVEFRNVATRPVAINGLGLSAAETEALAATFEMVVLGIVLRKRIGGFGDALWSSAARTLATTVLFAPLAFWMGRELAAATDPGSGRSMGLYLLFAYGMGVAGLAYLTLAFLFGAPELPAFASRLPIVGPRISALLAPRYRPRRR